MKNELSLQDIKLNTANLLLKARVTKDLLYDILFKLDIEADNLNTLASIRNASKAQEDYDTACIRVSHLEKLYSWY